MSMIPAYVLLVLFALVSTHDNTTTAQVLTGLAKVHQYSIGLDKSIDVLLRKTCHPPPPSVAAQTTINRRLLSD